MRVCHKITYRGHQVPFTSRCWFANMDALLAIPAAARRGRMHAFSAWADAFFCVLRNECTFWRRVASIVVFGKETCEISAN
jgi:hypothetical protein